MLLHSDRGRSGHLFGRRRRLVSGRSSRRIEQRSKFMRGCPSRFGCRSRELANNHLRGYSPGDGGLFSSVDADLRPLGVLRGGRLMSPKDQVAVALDVGGTTIKTALIARDGTLLALERIPSPSQSPPEMSRN